MLTEVESLEPPYPDVLEVVRQFGQQLPSGAFAGANWTLANASTADMLKKMESAGQPLGDYVDGRIYRGILTGFNAAFVIDGARRAELIAKDPKSEEIIKPLILGKDVEKWHVAERDRWLIYSSWALQLDDYPSVRDHLQRWKEQLAARPECRDGRYNWWCLGRYGAEYAPAFDEAKILYQEIATYQAFALDRKGAYVNNKVFLIASGELYLLGLLDSARVWEYLKHVCAKLSGGAYAMQRPYIQRIPIPSASPSDREAIAALAQKCLDAKGVGCEEWEREIDERVAGLYGL